MNESVTLTFVPQQLITWVFVGLIAGLLAGLLIRGQGIGFVLSVVVGLLGALLGGFLFTVLGIQVPPAFNGGIMLAWADMFVAFIGAVIILLLFGGFYHRRRRVLA
jgi:uncharacterized membrane protein YeaQ/YmgE (transglycosylase-associated protein family)